MRQIYDGLAYDTTKAEKLAETKSGDRDYLEWGVTVEAAYVDYDPVYEETLYRTSSGRYFLHGRGNGNSRWAGFQKGEGIKVLTEARAKEWAEKNAQESYEKIFGPADEA